MVLNQVMAPKGIRFQIPGNVNVTLYDKMDFEDVNLRFEIVGLSWRVSWIIQVCCKCNHELPYKREAKENLT